MAMNEYTRKQCPPKNNWAGQCKFSEARHAEMSSEGRDGPFPNKPVCHKRLVNPTTHGVGDCENLSDSKKSQHPIPDSIRHTGDSPRLTAGELQMTRVIQEKQLLLQKKLWKVEDTLRQRIQRDHSGVYVKGSQKTAEKGFYGGEPNPKFKQKTEVTGGEMLNQSVQNPRHKFRQDTITMKHKEDETQWDNQSVGNKVFKGKEETRVKYVYDQKTPSKSQPKASQRLVKANHENTVGPVPEEDVLLQVSTLSLKAEHTDSSNKHDQLLQCNICNRKFMHNRLEKHVQICERVNKSKRPVFNSYMHRNKGSAVEEFLKTHPRSTTPEVLRKKKLKQKK